MFDCRFFENVRRACRNTIREIKHGFHSQTLVNFAVETQHAVSDATPKSDSAMHQRLCAYYGRNRHTADAWDVELDTNYYGGVIGFFINNTEKAGGVYIVDLLEYGVSPHIIEQPSRGNAWAHPGIFPMGFVRQAQENMERKTPAIVRKYFDDPISKFWSEQHHKYR